MKGLWTGLGVVGVMLVVFLGWKFWSMGVQKGEIELSNRYDAQFNVVETSLFKMRTTIKNQHNCTTEWADKFIGVVMAQSKGRPGNFAEQGQSADSGLIALGGTGYKEADVLGIPQDLYLKLSNSIEGQLAEFKRSQDVLTDVWREHTTYCQDPYHNWLGVYLVSKVKTKPEMITSAETKTAVETKQMDENLL